MKNSTIESVLNGRAKEGWMIFRYRLFRSLFKLVMRLFFLGLFGAGLASSSLRFNEGEPCSMSLP